MNAATKSAPVRHGRASTRATRNPNLCEKDEPVPDILHQRLIRRAQRHAARTAPRTGWALPPSDLPLAWYDYIASLASRLDAATRILGEAYREDGYPVPPSLGAPPPRPRTAPDDMDPVYGPPAGHPEAESLPLGAEHDVMLAGWSLDLWPRDEYEQIAADAAPVLAGPVWYCPRCGSGSTAGPCGCGGQS